MGACVRACVCVCARFLFVCESRGRHSMKLNRKPCEFTVTAFQCDEKCTPEVKTAKGLKRCRVKVKGVNNTA